MTTNLLIGFIAILIIYQGIQIYKQQRELKRTLKKLEDDMNIEFGAPEGGISLEKKQYPDMEYKDDFREGTGEIKK